jgi:hypothetical protein
MTIEEVFVAVRHVLLHSLIRVDDPELGTLIGWPHFFNDPSAHARPNAIGTAYGLKLMLLLDAQPHAIDPRALATTLWKFRRPDGGWAARTGTGFSLPEVSALVIGALAAAGSGTMELAAACEMFERSLSQGLDPMAIERTYVVSAIIRGLVRVHPQSENLTALRTALLSGAIRGPDQHNLIYWSDRMPRESDEALDLPPSPAHTAQAIVALVRARDVLGEDLQSRITLNQAVRWLASDRRLDNQTEQIRRPARDSQPWDRLTVRHFTAAWVARALLALPTGLPEARSLLTDAVDQVWNYYREGYWEWDDGDRPTWMAYQGTCVLRELASRE